MRRYFLIRNKPGAGWSGTELLMASRREMYDKEHILHSTQLFRASGSSRKSTQLPTCRAELVGE